MTVPEAQKNKMVLTGVSHFKFTRFPILVTASLPVVSLLPVSTRDIKRAEVCGVGKEIQGVCKDAQQRTAAAEASLTRA